jgi:hypothetical protein
MKDIVCKSTYMLKKPITLDNIFIFDSGLGLYFGDLQFKEECVNNKQEFELYEAKVMKNYAKILLSILYPKQHETGPDKLFEDLKAVVDPVLYYIIWFTFKESKERRKKYFEGISTKT